MKVILVDPMPFHPLLCYPGTTQPLQAIGLNADGLPIWPLLGADGEGDDGGGEDDADGDEEEDDSEDSDEDESEDEDKSAKNKKKRTGPVSREEFDAQTNRLRAADKRRSDAEKRAADLQKYKDEQERKGNTELQNVQKDLADVTKERDSLQDRFTTLARTNAFLTASAQLKIVWHDPADAQAAGGKALRDLEIDEDGNVEGIDAFVKDLAKRKKYLVNAGKDDDEGDEEKGKQTRRGTSGSGVGSVRTVKKKPPNGQLSDEELRKRFPALGRGR